MNLSVQKNDGLSGDDVEFTFITSDEAKRTTKATGKDHAGDRQEVDLSHLGSLETCVFDDVTNLGNSSHDRLFSTPHCIQRLIHEEMLDEKLQNLTLVCDLGFDYGNGFLHHYSVRCFAPELLLIASKALGKH